RVGGDVLARAFLRQRNGEAMDAGLGGGVVGLAELAGLAVDRGDVDDAPEAALAHALDDLPGNVESSGEVNADHRVPVALVHLVEEAVTGNAGAVDQDVDRAVLGFDLLGHGLAGIEVSDVALYPADVVTLGLASRLPFLDLFLLGID